MAAELAAVILFQLGAHRPQLCVDLAREIAALYEGVLSQVALNLFLGLALVQEQAAPVAVVAKGTPKTMRTRLLCSLRWARCAFRRSAEVSLSRPAVSRPVVYSTNQSCFIR